MTDVTQLSLAFHMKLSSSKPSKLKPFCFMGWQFISIVHSVMSIILDEQILLT